MAEVEVQTTMFAHPIRVPEEEVAVLRAQGLLTETRRPAAEGERRYPVTEVPDQTPAGGDAGKDDKAKAETAGAKPGSEESTK